ncbi:MAG: hypothetical protein SFZ23_12725 [Planctomycetota bacterium]|nr:hypothetical protein [Planctomycetota bacterium]
MLTTLLTCLGLGALSGRDSGAGVVACAHAAAPNAPVPQASALGLVSKLPGRIELALVLERGVKQRIGPAGEALTQAVSASSAFAPLRQAWTEFASQLGMTPVEAFDELLGRRVIMVATDLDDRFEWALLTDVSGAAEARLRSKLRPAPRTISGGLPILTVEGGRYQLTTTEPRLVRTETATESLATLLIAPTDQGDELFDELLGLLSSGLMSENASALSPQEPTRSPWPLSTTPAFRQVARQLAVQAGTGQSEGGPGGAGTDPSGDVFLFVREPADAAGSDEAFFAIWAFPSPTGWRANVLASDSSLDGGPTQSPDEDELPAWAASAAGGISHGAVLAMAGTAWSFSPVAALRVAAGDAFVEQWLGPGALADVLGARVAVALRLVKARDEDKDDGSLTPDHSTEGDGAMLGLTFAARASEPSAASAAAGFERALERRLELLEQRSGARVDRLTGTSAALVRPGAQGAGELPPHLVRWGTVRWSTVHWGMLGVDGMINARVDAERSSDQAQNKPETTSGTAASERFGVSGLVGEGLASRPDVRGRSTPKENESRATLWNVVRFDPLSQGASGPIAPPAAAFAGPEGGPKSGPEAGLEPTPGERPVFFALLRPAMLESALARAGLPPSPLASRWIQKVLVRAWKVDGAENLVRGEIELELVGEMARP